VRRRRVEVAVAAVLAVAGLTAAMWYDVHARTRTRNEESTLTAADHHLARLRHGLALTKFANAVTTNTRNGLQASIGTTLSQTSGVESSLNSTNAVASQQNTGITTLHTCLGGVQNALNEISANDNTQAAKDISAVSGPCASLANTANDGLVYPFDFPDPDVIVVGQTYYAYATNSVAGNIQIIDSSDLVHWTAVGNALPALPAWATPDDTWAPSVAEVNGQFLMYYAVDVAISGTECISVATSSSPQGPFVDSSTGPLECQTSLGGSIDPSTFTSFNGLPYLVWKSNDANPSKLWAEQLDAAGTGFAPGTTPSLLLSADQGWEGGVIEAPDMVPTDGRYFLFYSGNDWNSANYAVGVAICSGPLGPCGDVTASPILSSGPGVAGPGGESVFTDTSGSYWIAFHAWVPGAVGFPNSRDLYIRQLDLSGAVPAVGGPPSG
jgi:Glycosyl hydrolases family 43